MERDTLEALCRNLTEEQLDHLAKSFRQTAAERFPLRPQLGGDGSRDPKNNNEFMI